MEFCRKLGFVFNLVIYRDFMENMVEKQKENGGKMIENCQKLEKVEAKIQNSNDQVKNKVAESQLEK